MHAVALLVAGFGALGGSAAQAQGSGVGDKDYVWNEMRGEKLQALMAKGDAARGEIAFEVCAGCHKSGAVGRPDGTYPRLAGQHASVLIKQMVDIRAGRRKNPKMLPFASQHVLSPQDIADIAVYLEGLPVPAENGRGPGTALEAGRKLYVEDCQSCHGAAGEGDGARFYPRLSGQHYAYLLREGLAIREGERGNANPKMMKIIRPYSDADLKAALDYASRLSVDGR
ncbi:MAG: c-type cytochrome [Rhodocyclaceae bacterium]|nr:c-type cytochrome [Rhodocyclaceae bacterium]